MKTAYMIHEVVLKNGRITPKTVVTDMDDATFAELEALGAAREATEDEATLAIAMSVPPADVPAVDPKAAKAAKAAAKAAAAEKAAAEEAAAKEAAAAAQTATDPDVTENDLLGGN